MIEPAYHFCPRDGAKLKITKEHSIGHQVCTQCGNTLYINQSLTVSAVIVRDDNLLVVRRGLEPFKNMLDLPGGFVEPQETAREGILRELMEELHVEGRLLRAFEVLGPDPYPFAGVTHHNADMLYQVDIGGETPKAHDDVASFEWIALSELAEEKFAFPSHRQFIVGLKAGEFELVK